ncbi:unnamed protein product [Pleuronectes platessa]|uniref:Uncharacterized protein n=1 Tax=Pleuronectes platessa TaxID=8262 RepID=A0A9N7VBR0_PLEPL|nr:unnamed protein product [Pleuronectes platessa]
MEQLASTKAAHGATAPGPPRPASAQAARWKMYLVLAGTPPRILRLSATVINEERRQGTGWDWLSIRVDSVPIILLCPTTLGQGEIPGADPPYQSVQSLPISS